MIARIDIPNVREKIEVGQRITVTGEALVVAVEADVIDVGHLGRPRDGRPAPFCDMVLGERTVTVIIELTIPAA